MATSVAKWLILGREHPFFINFTEEPAINEEVSKCSANEWQKGSESARDQSRQNDEYSNGNWRGLLIANDRVGVPRFGRNFCPEVLPFLARQAVALRAQWNADGVMMRPLSISVCCKCDCLMAAKFDNYLA